MQLVTLDFETYYDVGFSLSGLTTEEYIRDARFQVIGVAIKIDEGETYWVTGSHEVVQEALNKIDWHNSALLCHNTQFDGLFLHSVLVSFLVSTWILCLWHGLLMVLR